MANRSIKKAFGESLKAEEAAIKDRFDRAESLLTRNDIEVLAKNEAAPVKVEEPRVKRDSFTMPVSDYELIAVLQKRCLQSQVSANKSELLRAGLVALNGLSPEDLVKLIESLPRVKTGRPPQG